MFKIAICDDEGHFRRQIQDILIQYMDEKGILFEISEFKSGKDFINLGIGINSYQIVFLDINMEELDGMETARKIREISHDIFIAFVTAYANYALDGYQVDAVRYILKNNLTLAESLFECMDTVTAKMNCAAAKKMFHFHEGSKNISLERLLFIESRLHKLEFYIMEEKLNKYTLYGTLNSMEEELSGHTFVRIHQSYLVNMKHIAKVSRYEVLLNNGRKLVIPKKRYQFVEETFVSYKGEL